MELFCLVRDGGYKTLHWSKPTALHIEVCPSTYTNSEHVKEAGGSRDGMQTVTTASDHITNVWCGLWEGGGGGKQLT